ncbi:MAG: thiamine phosphate synthase [Syntrophaceae bacterium]|nr:thiamine phosphate synthase [Syntrophaceae bacterium]
MLQKYKSCMTGNSLYLVLSEEYGGAVPLLRIAEQAIAGGVDILQMREKHKSNEELINLGKRLASLCKKNEVTFIVNDDPLLAKALEADGVHLGQEDIRQYPISRVRQIIGKDKIIGLSTHSLEQFRLANQMDVDYLAFGPIFSTKTKNYHIGTGDVSKVLQTALKPVVFIGGINTDNLDVLLAAGVSNIALIRDIMQAEDIIARTKWYKSRLMMNKKTGR